MIIYCITVNSTENYPGLPRFFTGISGLFQANSGYHIKYPEKAGDKPDNSGKIGNVLL